MIEVFQSYRPTVPAQTTRGSLYPSRYLYPSKDLLPGREHLKALLGPSKQEWRALAAVEPDSHHRILDVTDPADRGWLEREITAVLASLGIQQVTAHVLTDPDRDKTQRIARAAFERGIGGIRYPSNVGAVPCIALFEGHARFVLNSPPAPRLIDADMDEARELLNADIELIRDEADDNTAELAGRSGA